MARSPRRPPALKHGLSSRHARSEWPQQVVELADAMVGSGPREPPVLEAAREAAEATLYLRRVLQWKLQA